MEEEVRKRRSRLECRIVGEDKSNTEEGKYELFLSHYTSYRTLCSFFFTIMHYSINFLVLISSSCLFYIHINFSSYTKSAVSQLNEDFNSPLLFFTNFVLISLLFSFHSYLLFFLFYSPYILIHFYVFRSHTHFYSFSSIRP